MQAHRAELSSREFCPRLETFSRLSGCISELLGTSDCFSFHFLSLNRDVCHYYPVAVPSCPLGAENLLSNIHRWRGILPQDRVSPESHLCLIWMVLIGLGFLRLEI